MAKVGQSSGRRRLGQLLVEENLVSREDLKAALKEQKKGGGFLGEILLKKSLIKEADLRRILAKQLSFPFMETIESDITQEVCELFPLEILDKHQFVPMAKLGQVITVASTEPLK